MDPLEEEFPFSYFLQDKIEIYDATIIEEREKKQKRHGTKKFKEWKKKKENKMKAKKPILLNFILHFKGDKKSNF